MRQSVANRRRGGMFRPVRRDRNAEGGSSAIENISDFMEAVQLCANTNDLRLITEKCMYMLIEQKREDIDNALEKVHAQRHYIPSVYLCLLEAKTFKNLSKEDSLKLIQEGHEFLEYFSKDKKQDKDLPDEKISIRRYVSYCHSLCESLAKRDSDVIQSGLVLLDQVNIWLTRGSEELSAIHASIMQLLFANGQYDMALSILDKEFVDICTRDNNYDAKYYLYYNYYSGCVLMAVQDYKRAACFFARALSTPAVVVVKMLSDSAKKMLLCSLISNWDFDNALIPVVRSLLCKTTRVKQNMMYLEFARQWGNLWEVGREQLGAFVNANQQLFEEDGNWNLVQLCCEARLTFGLYRLTKIFANIPVLELVQRGDFESQVEMESHLLALREHGVTYVLNEEKLTIQFSALRNDVPSERVREKKKSVEQLLLCHEKLLDNEAKFSKDQDFMERLKLSLSNPNPPVAKLKPAMTPQRFQFRGKQKLRKLPMTDNNGSSSGGGWPRAVRAPNFSTNGTANVSHSFLG